MDRSLVDGHNALHALRMADRGGHEDDRKALLRRIGGALPGALVYFDGRHGPQGLPRVFRQEGVKVHYCKDDEADHEIVADVRHAVEPRLLTVVTNDRELAGRCRQLGARVLRVDQALGDPHEDAAPGRDPTAPGRRPRLPARGTGAGSPGRPLDVDERPLTPADFGLPDEVDPNDPRWR